MTQESLAVPFQLQQCSKGIGMNGSHECSVCRDCVTHMGDKADASPICKRTLTPEHSLTTQQLTQSDGKEWFTCSVSSQRFLCLQNLVTHESTHMDERPFQSYGCSVTFMWKVLLTSHMLTHVGEGLHKCDMCSLQFTHKATLSHHRHMCEKPYMCELCPSTFCRKKSLDRHKQLHARGVDLCHCNELARRLHRGSLGAAPAVPCNIKVSHMPPVFS